MTDFIKNLKKLDYLHIGSILLSVLGLILEIIGGSISVPETVGMNTNLNIMVWIGLALIVLSLVVSIYGSVITEKQGLNKTLSTIAIYLAVVALMFSSVYILLVMLMPVLHPTNG